MIQAVGEGRQRFSSTECRARAVRAATGSGGELSEPGRELCLEEGLGGMAEWKNEVGPVHLGFEQAASLARTGKPMARFILRRSGRGDLGFCGS